MSDNDNHQESDDKLAQLADADTYNLSKSSDDGSDVDEDMDALDITQELGNYPDDTLAEMAQFDLGNEGSFGPVNSQYFDEKELDELGSEVPSPQIDEINGQMDNTESEPLSDNFTSLSDMQPSLNEEDNKEDKMVNEAFNVNNGSGNKEPAAENPTGDAVPTSGLTQKKLKIIKYSMFGVVGLVFMSIVFFGMSIMNDDSKDKHVDMPDKAIIQTQPVAKVLPVRKPIQQGKETEHQAGIEGQTTNFFNSINNEEKTISDDKNYANTDPTTVNVIEQYKQELANTKGLLSSTQSELAIQKKNVKDLRSELDSSQVEVARLKTQLSDSREETQKTKSDLNKERKLRLDAERNLELKGKQLTVSQKEVANQKGQLALLNTELEREKSRVDRLVQDDSKGYDKMAQAVGALRNDINSKLSTKQAADANQMLSSLKLVSVDPRSGFGKFITIKNGKPVKEITLQAGEKLLGRGTVKMIDAYGCIFFEDGQQYEPMNGYCEK